MGAIQIPFIIIIILYQLYKVIFFFKHQLQGLPFLEDNHGSFEVCPWGRTDDLSALLCLFHVCYLKSSFWRAFVPGAKQMICLPCFVCASFAVCSLASEELLSLGQKGWSVCLALFVPPLLSEVELLKSFCPWGKTDDLSALLCLWRLCYLKLSFWRAFVPGAKQMICLPCFVCPIFAICSLASVLKSFGSWGKTDGLSALLVCAFLCQNVCTLVSVLKTICPWCKTDL